MELNFSLQCCWCSLPLNIADHCPFLGAKWGQNPYPKSGFYWLSKQCRCNHTWRLMIGSQAFWVILVPQSIFGWGRSKLFCLFEISFPWTFQWYMIWSYSVNTYFPIFAPFWVWDRFLGGAGSGWDRTKHFCSFWNLLYMDFPMVFDTTILNEHPFLTILKGRTNFWVGQEVDGAGQFFFYSKHSPYGG